MVILLVGNNKNELYHLKKYVEECYSGNRILEFHDALKALDFIKKNPVDLLFTEIMMHQVSGFALSKALREQEMRARVVFIAESKDFAMAARKAYINDYLLKPINRQSVEHTLQQC